MKIILKLLTWLAALFLAALLVFFFFRESFLKKAVDHVIQKVKTEKNLTLTIGNYGFQSFMNVAMDDIKAIGPGGDTLLTLDSLFVSPRILSVLKGDPEFSFIQLHRPYLRVRKDSTGDNFSFLFKSDDTLLHEPKNGGPGAAMNRLLSYFFRQVPDELTVTDLRADVSWYGRSAVLQSRNMLVHDELIGGEISFPSDSMNATYGVKGNVDRDDETISAMIFRKDSTDFLPFLKSYTGLELRADTLSFSLDETTFSDNVLRLKGSADCRNLYASHWRIAPEPVIIGDASFNYDVVLTPDSVYIDSSSLVRIEKLKLHPQLTVVNGKDKVYDLKVSIPETSINDFFGSLPSGVFEHTSGIRGKGSLSYGLKFRYDEANLESLQFHSEIKRNDIKIETFGKTDPRKMNKEFNYTAYEKGKAVRTFPVGPSNTSFTPLEGISPYLRASVMTSEDGSFFYHKGFNEDAFRKSIIENIKEKRFKRGGSTISMQLVKNVLLNRNKNVSRKIEEVLLVWLIESNRIVSKERMYEVYLNIIEWGPGVYGAGEASRFYFGKSPSELSLNESIFLAMIVPQPKGFRYHFDKTGHLKEHCSAYYNVIARHLVKRSVITEEEQASLVADVDLTGPAGKFVKLEPDTMVKEELEIREVN